MRFRRHRNSPKLHVQILQRVRNIRAVVEVAADRSALPVPREHLLSIDKTGCPLSHSWWLFERRCAGHLIWWSALACQARHIDA